MLTISRIFENRPLLRYCEINLLFSLLTLFFHVTSWVSISPFRTVYFVQQETCVNMGSSLVTYWVDHFSGLMVWASTSKLSDRGGQTGVGSFKNDNSSFLVWHQYNFGWDVMSGVVSMIFSGRSTLGAWRSQEDMLYINTRDSSLSYCWKIV